MHMKDATHEFSKYQIQREAGNQQITTPRMLSSRISPPLHRFPDDNISRSFLLPRASPFPLVPPDRCGFVALDYTAFIHCCSRIGNEPPRPWYLVKTPRIPTRVRSRKRSRRGQPSRPPWPAARGCSPTAISTMCFAAPLADFSAALLAPRSLVLHFRLQFLDHPPWLPWSSPSSFFLTDTSRSSDPSSPSWRCSTATSGRRQPHGITWATWPSREPSSGSSCSATCRTSGRARTRCCSRRFVCSSSPP